MLKTLQSIGSCENITHPALSKILPEIVERAEGDLRSAINMLQFMSQKHVTSKPAVKRAKESKSITDTSSLLKKIETIDLTSIPEKMDLKFSISDYHRSENDQTAHDSKSLLLFRALGRVLYCKSKLQPCTFFRFYFFSYRSFR